MRIAAYSASRRHWSHLHAASRSGRIISARRPALPRGRRRQRPGIDKTAACGVTIAARRPATINQRPNSENSESDSDSEI